MGDTSTIRKLKMHPFAKQIPSMSEAEYIEFEKDVKANGINTPLVVWSKDENVVLDGRHRLRAAKANGDKFILSRVETLPENVTPEMYILKTALLRRHPTSDQRGFLATRLRDAQTDLNKKLKAKWLKSGKKGKLSNIINTSAWITAAKAARVSMKKMQDIDLLKQEALDLYKKAKAGEITIAKAMRLLRERRLKEAIKDATEAKDGAASVLIIEDLKKLPEDLSERIADNAALWIWSKGFIGQEQYEAIGRVLGEYGLKLEAIFHWVRQDTEAKGARIFPGTRPLILATKGKPKLTLKAQSNTITGKLSTKDFAQVWPSTFYKLVKTVSVGGVVQWLAGRWTEVE